MASQVDEQEQDDAMVEQYWPEDIINENAIVRGYLSLGIRGLGFLVLTWSTAVLLGGYVGTLGKMDFWCLTIITFLQAAKLVVLPMNSSLT